MSIISARSTVETVAAAGENRLMRVDLQYKSHPSRTK